MAIIEWRNIKIMVCNFIFNFLFTWSYQLKTFNPITQGLDSIGITLGKVIAPLVMLVIFFAIVTPIGLLLKIFGKDLLKIKK